MAVSLTISSTAGGTPELLPQSFGTLTPGVVGTPEGFYLSHDGLNIIEDVRFYLFPYNGVYAGSRTANDDYATFIAWGDGSPSSTTGYGLYLSMDAAGGFVAGSYQNFSTGNGDSLANAITLDEDAISTGTPAGDGVIPVAGEAHIQLRLDIPSTVIMSGAFYVTLMTAYTATS